MKSDDTYKKILDFLEGDNKQLNILSTLTKKEKELIIELIKEYDPYLIDRLWRLNYRFKPVGIETFLDSKYYIGDMANYLYDIWREGLKEVYSPLSTTNELIFTGAIGIGKTSVSIISTLYILYRVTAMLFPQNYYNMPSMQTIYIALFSVTREKASQALLGVFKSELRNTEHFQEVKSPAFFNDFIKENPNQIPYYEKEHEIEFPGNIKVMEGSTEFHALSLSIISGILDEANFRRGGFQEAFNLYHAIRERIRSRFLGKLGYMMHLISSKRYTDSPVETYIRSISPEDKTTKVFDFPKWKANSSMYSGEKFYVFTGSKTIPPKILDEEEKKDFKLPPQTSILEVPIEYKKDFEADIYRALRDIAGVSTSSINPFFTDTSVIDNMWDKNLKNVSVNVTTSRTKNYLIEVLKDNGILVKTLSRRYSIYRARDEKRYTHTDLGETNDKAGVAMVHKEIDEDGSIIYIVDFAFAISPSSTEEIYLDAIREMWWELMSHYGIKIEKLTYDKYQSSSHIQFFKAKKKKAGLLSVDRTTEPYYTLKMLMTMGKVKCGYNKELESNLLNLEKQEEKIDHKPGGAKDVSDALAGAIYNAYTDKHLPTFSYKAEKIIRKKVEKKIVEENIKKKQNNFSIFGNFLKGIKK